MNEEDRVVKKAAWRLVPFLCLLYFVAFLDRVNVGFAALTMNADLGLSASAFGTGAGIFFLGYFLCEIPSNLALKKLGARIWIARIMVTWGLICVGMAFISGPKSFWVMRFLLGLAEAGFFPGMILYLTFWFPNSIRGTMIGYCLLANPLSNIIGAPLSSALLGLPIAGFAGWQTMFIIEGIPAIVLGIVVYFYLSDSPATAPWLDDKERAILQRAIERDQAPVQHASLRAAFTSGPVWLFACIYFGLNLGVYGFGFWAPQMIRSLGQFSNMQTGLVTMLPYTCAGAAMFLWGRHSDRTGERVWHIAASAFVGATAFLLGSHTDNLWLGVAAFCVGAVGIYGALPIFWTLPTAMLSGTAAAAGIALINSIGTLSGYVGPVVVGQLKDLTNSYSAGLLVIAGALLLSGLLTVFGAKNGRKRSAVKSLE